MLESAGASIIRDSVDTRVTNDVKNRTGKIIDKPSDVGGYPTLDGGTMSKDSDLDGIPNEYEDKNGLDKNSSSDAVKINPSTGYMYIEEYANALADGSYVRDTAYDETLPQPTIVPRLLKHRILTLARLLKHRLFQSGLQLRLILINRQAPSLCRDGRNDSVWTSYAGYSCF